MRLHRKELEGQRAIDDDFAAITKATGGAATEQKTSYRDEPPGDDDVLPAVPPAEFAKTRAAINDITGVHIMAEMMRATGKSGGAGGNFGGGTSGSGSTAKKQKTAYEMLRSLVGSEMCIRDRCH